MNVFGKLLAGALAICVTLERQHSALAYRLLQRVIAHCNGQVATNARPKCTNSFHNQPDAMWILASATTMGRFVVVLLGVNR